MTHPAVQPHLDAAAKFQDAVDKHTAAAEAHEAGDHEKADEISRTAKQAGLEAALLSDIAATTSKGTRR